MILPDGHSDVPAGKIAAIVTHLEMTERPALPPDPAGAWTLLRVERPVSTGFAICIAASARNCCGPHGHGCLARNWPGSFMRLRWNCTPWSMTAATKACLSWIFSTPVNAKSFSSVSPRN